MIVFDHCKKCKYYIQYYALNDFHFRPAYGICVCTKRASRPTKPLEFCDYCEEGNRTPEQTKKSVEATIYDINEKLYNILEVLRLDKKEY